MIKKILLAGILALGLAKAQQPVKPVDGNYNELAKGPTTSVTWTSATAQNATLGITLNSYSSVEVSITPGAGTVTGGVVTFENPAALGNTSGATQQCYALTGVTGGGSTFTLTTATTNWQCPVGGLSLFQVRLSTVISGTASITVSVTPYTGQVHIDNIQLAAGTNSIGTVILGGATTYTAAQQAVTATAAALGTNTSKSVCVEALSTNTISIYLGATGVTTSTGFELTPGSGRCINVSNSNLIFVVASATGASVTYDWTN